MMKIFEKGGWEVLEGGVVSGDETNVPGRWEDCILYDETSASFEVVNEIAVDRGQASLWELLTCADLCRTGDENHVFALRHHLVPPHAPRFVHPDLCSHGQGCIKASIA
ncbi:hypothetical protein PHLCEN_2v9327 [Hermanssonia centrifuga]|uniref:Uncharacterized protein n=1 Tax=Hermanssonia centrifuga TaxID=98765 RepID=A0A2R6NR81_9APHY|nr:hypothetical protein PHLCEN_2v9327 [Hermanssonia centrifuga]